MTSTVELDIDNVELTPTERPRPLNSLVAAAQRMKEKKLKRPGHRHSSEAWQEDAWDMYDLVGEQRFLATTLSNRMAQAKFFVGKLPENPTEDIEPLTSGPAYDAFETMLGKGNSFNQMAARMGLNLFMPGDGYLVGLPPKEAEKEGLNAEISITPFGEDEEADEIDITTLEWKMMSLSEIEIDESSGEAEIKHYGTRKLDDIFLIRVWRPHPRFWWNADSPTRSSLPVLRELVGLTMGVSAQIDSRLAGAGILFVPASADQAMRAAAGMTGDDDLSPFAEGLMDAMITPIEDRSSASAVVPLMPVVPDESIEKFKWLMHPLAGNLDAEYREERDHAIRRLALGQDCPPELLLGVSGMNHWGAWLVREDVVTTHLEPPLALFCDAITTQFLWAVLEQQGVADFEQFVVWYDVDHLIMRPDRSRDALAVHTAGALSDKSLRDASGFDESDAPPADPNDDITKLVLDMIRDAPTLVQNPGLKLLNEQIRAMVEGSEIPQLPAQEAIEEGVAEEESQPEPSTEGGPPETEGEPAGVEAQA